MLSSSRSPSHSRLVRHCICACTYCICVCTNTSVYVHIYQCVHRVFLCADISYCMYICISSCRNVEQLKIVIKLVKHCIYVHMLYME